MLTTISETLETHGNRVTDVHMRMRMIPLRSTLRLVYLFSYVTLGGWLDRLRSISRASRLFLRPKGDAMLAASW